MPDVDKVLAGQVALDPLHTSCGSQPPTLDRQTVPVTNLQFDPQQTDPAMPVSQSSPALDSMLPLPHSEVYETVTKWPSLDCVRPGDPG